MDPSVEPTRIAVVGTVSTSMVSFRGPLLRALSEAGHTVFAFATDYDEQCETAVRELNATPVSYTLDRTGTRPLLDLRSIWQLRELFREHRIDRVLSYFIKPVAYGTVAGKLARVKRCDAMLPGLGYYFIKDDSRPPLGKRVVAGVVRSMLRYSLQRNARVIVYNHDDSEELIARGLVQAERLARVNGTGIDLAAYPFIEPPHSPVTFLLAARLLVAKGIVEYLTAARHVKRRYPQARFVLLGEPDTSPDGLRADQVYPFVNDGTVEWPGRVADIRPWVRSSSVYVLPSYYREGVPRSTQEALATGRPVITTNSTGCRETVIDGENGFLVPVRDAEALTRKMITFIENPALIVRMGRRSRALAETRFDVVEINKELLRILDLA